MRTFKVDCDVEGWQGYVVLKHISYDDKWDYLEEHGDISKLEGKEQMKAIRAMVKAAEKYYVEVSVKNEAKGEELKCLDDLKNTPEMHSWLMSLGIRVFNGNVGNV